MTGGGGGVDGLDGLGGLGAVGGTQAVGGDGGDGGLEAASFEELMGELESVTATLAAGDIGIEAAVELYERAEALHAAARARLDQVRARVEKLTGPV